MSQRHEWVTAAEANDSEVLSELIASSGEEPTNAKPGNGLIAACEKDSVLACEVLRRWGVPVDNPDSNGKRALHVAAFHGSLNCIRFLCQTGADFEIADHNRATPLKVAIQNRQMKAAKELLLFDAKLPDDLSTPGLAAVFKEVQIDKLALHLKQISQEQEVTHEELTEADEGVWRCQREHQRLLRLRENQRAGKALRRYDDRLAEEMAAAERSKNREAENMSDIGEKRVELLKHRTDLSELVKELQSLMSAEMATKMLDDKQKAELKLRRGEYDHVESDIQARQAVLKGEQGELESAEERWQYLEAEIVQQRHYTADEEAELAAAQREFKGWRLDREAAALLTGQAHLILGA